MMYGNIRRIKAKLELTVPGLADRTDYDENLTRNLGVAHEKVRFVITKVNSGAMPDFVELQAPTAIVSPFSYSALAEVGRRLRLVVADADADELATTPMVVTITGTVAGIITTEDVSINDNGEFISTIAWDAASADLIIADIPTPAGTLQVIQDVDPILSDAEELLTACLFLTEAVDRFEEDADPAEFEPWCTTARKMLDAWATENLAGSRVQAPLALRARS